LWVAQLASNVGTWMQNVGAAWLMGDVHGTPTQVALIQTATSLPVFVVGLAAGAIADVVDRRRLLLATQAWMLLVAGLLALTTALGAVRPVTLLLMTFALGLGAALNLPAWQAIQPELVPRDELPRAVALGAMSMNLGRSVGPAVGGALVAASGPAAVFGINALSFVGVLVALIAWRRPHERDELPPERLLNALRAGVRYAQHSPALRAVLVRAALFTMPASAMMALLPVVSRDRLHLGSGGFGALFACVGAGAVAAAFVVPHAQARGVDRTILAASVMIGTALAGMAALHEPIALAPLLVVGGAGWTAGFSTFNVSAQSVLPAWVRARGMGLYVLVIQGGLAIGSATWGTVAARSTGAALGVPAGLVVVATWSSATRWRLTRKEQLDLRVSSYWPEPVLEVEVDPDRGPVLITVEYRVPEPNRARFTDAMRKVQRMRRRTGARRWGLYQDSADPERYVETFVVDSWEEHLRQHQRTTAADELAHGAAKAFLAPGTAVRTSHLLWAY